jgi:hypothetical protein
MEALREPFLLLVRLILYNGLRSQAAALDNTVQQ